MRTCAKSRSYSCAELCARQKRCNRAWRHSKLTQNELGREVHGISALQVTLQFCAQLCVHLATYDASNISFPDISSSRDIAHWCRHPLPCQLCDVPFPFGVKILCFGMCLRQTASPRRFPEILERTRCISRPVFWKQVTAYCSMSVRDDSFISPDKLSLNL